MHEDEKIEISTRAQAREENEDVRRVYTLIWDRRPVRGGRVVAGALKNDGSVRVDDGGAGARVCLGGYGISGPEEAVSHMPVGSDSGQ